MLSTANLLADLPSSADVEVFQPLVQANNLRLERIVSTGQATPQGQWLVQDWDEWVLLVAGSAGLRIEKEDTTRTLLPGDWINIPVGVRHRVEWTCPDSSTVWLALHYNLP